MPAEPGSVHFRRGRHVDDVGGRGRNNDEDSMLEWCSRLLVIQFATDIQWVMQGVMRCDAEE